MRQDAQAQGSIMPDGRATIRPSGIWKSGPPGQPAQAASPQGHSGTTADDIMRQANASNPYNSSGDDPAGIQRSNEERIRAQMAKDPAYNPHLRNTTQFKPVLTKNEAVQKLLWEEGLKENHGQNLDRFSRGYYKGPEFARETQAYRNALQQLANMLSGKQWPSMADAYFYVEYAYGNPYLTQAEFKNIIRESASFIGQWMAQHKMSMANHDDVHLAIQRFMAQPLMIGNANPDKDQQKQFRTATHTPFFYDFNDYDGEKDFRNYFLTKCLATGSGQCSSMPTVYLCLAEALGTPAYLSLAPQHSFIKYKDSHGNIVNYEPTSDWKMSDRWYQDNMFITPEAKRNGLYLDTLNKKEIIADCVLSLAFGYMKKFGAADASFVSDCLDIAEPAFSRPRVQPLFIRSCLYARMLGTIMYATGITNKEDLAKSEEALAIYNNLEANEALIRKLGYRDQPKEMYNDLLKT